MKYLYCALLLLIVTHLSAQHRPKGKHLITGTLTSSANAQISGTIYIGDSLYQAQRAMFRQMRTLEKAQTLADDKQSAALEPAWAEWRTHNLTVMNLARDSTYAVHAKWKTGRFRFWARPQDTIYVEAPHHQSRRLRVADLPRRGRDVTLVLQSEKCITYVACGDTAGQEYVFIGRKISLERVPEPYYCPEPGIYRWSFYGEYTATYQLLTQLQGHYMPDTIAFSAFDHYGWPPFRRYQHALLFVKEYCGKLIYQRNFQPVYRTTDGRWAAPYQPYTPPSPELERPIKPRLIPFAEPVAVDVSRADSAYLARTYPAPYYRIENGQALAVYGNYVEEILENQRRLRDPVRAWNRRHQAELRAKFPPESTKQP